MREIKFRAWDSVNTCQKLSVGTVEYFDDMLAFRFAHFDQDPEGIIFEQYTGLLDRNGKKIFEGDIVHLANRGPNVGVIGKVIYKAEGAIGWRVIDSQKGRYNCFLNSNESIEVIGNIHENPELLK